MDAPFPQITCALDLFDPALRRLAHSGPEPIRLPAGRRWESSEIPAEVIAARGAAPGGTELWIELVERFHPPRSADLPSACIALLSIGRGLRRGRARGWLRDSAGRWQRARRLYLPGAGLFRIPLGPAGPLPPDSAEAEETAQRWSRTRHALGAATHDRLRGLAIGLIGLGRTGSILARNLAGLGVSRLVLVDPDTVELHNLGEGDFYTPDAIGQPKVHAWENWLALHGGGALPEIQVEAVPESVAHARAIAALSRCDLLFSVPDHPAARIGAAAIAAAYGRPLIDLGTRVLASGLSADGPVMGADIRLLLGHCLLCFGGIAEAGMGGDPRRALASPDFERAMLAGRDALAERAGSLHSLNQLAAALAMRLLEDTVLGRISASRWIRAEFAADGQLQVRHPEPAAPSGPCLCGLFGLGDAALPRVLPLLDALDALDEKAELGAAASVG